MKYLGKRKLYQLAKQLLQDELCGERNAYYTKYRGRERLSFRTSDYGHECELCSDYEGRYLSLRDRKFDEEIEDYGSESFQVINGFGRVGIAI